LKRLNHIFIYNDFYLEGFLIFFVILGFHHFPFFIISSIYIIILKNKIKIKVYVPLILFFSVMVYMLKNQDIPTQIDNQVKVIEITQYDFFDLLTIRFENKKYNLKLRNHQYKVGDIIYIQGNIHKYRNNTTEFGFNQNNYYLGKGIYGYIEIINHQYIESTFFIFSPLEEIKKTIDTLESSDYIYSFLFGKTRFNNEEYKLYKELNILFLFTVSGMHVYTLIYFIKKMMFYLNIEKKQQDIIILFVYIAFLYLNRFAHSILRLFIMYLFYFADQKLDIKLEKLDKIQITFLMILLLDFNLFFNQGFLMTYLIVVTLSLMEFRYNVLSFYYKRLFISTLIFLILLPFFNEISILMIFFLPIILMIITVPIYLMSIITLLVNEFDPIFYYILSKLNQLLTIIQNNNVLIQLPSLNIYLIILYYTTLILFFRSKNMNQFITRLIFLILITLIPFFNNQYKERITFLDVSQGDSTIIESSNCVIVVDAFQNVYSYMKSYGITEIDYLLLTHSDKDHIKEANQLIENLNVKNVGLSYYDHEYPNYHSNILLLKAGDQITCNHLSLHILAPLKKYDHKNSNSLVIQFLFDHQVFLLTGDIEADAEYDLANHYKNKLKSDVLKVSHHGSNTSSTKIFLSFVKPSAVIISSGYNNQFGFPSKDVLERLMTYNVMIYRTDLNGSIIYNAKKKNSKWKLYIPF
jgi:competence protein ComEC